MSFAYDLEEEFLNEDDEGAISSQFWLVKGETRLPLGRSALASKGVYKYSTGWSSQSPKLKKVLRENVVYRPSDIVVATFPKCGTTLTGTGETWSFPFLDVPFRVGNSEGIHANGSHGTGTLFLRLHGIHQHNICLQFGALHHCRHAEYGFPSSGIHTLTIGYCSYCNSAFSLWQQQV